MNNRVSPAQKKMRIRAGDWLSFIGSHCNGTLHGILGFNVRHWYRSPPCGDATGAVRLSRGRKLEIFISNAACKVRRAPPLQVIFMGPPRSNELIFTFYAFILVCSAGPERAASSATIKQKIKWKRFRPPLSLLYKRLCIPLIDRTRALAIGYLWKSMPVSSKTAADILILILRELNERLEPKIKFSNFKIFIEKKTHILIFKIADYVCSAII